MRPTPNVSGNFKPGLPDTIIVHYTAGSNLESAVQTLINPKGKASAHLVIGREGEIVQLAPFDVVTWHAGRSRWKDRTALNHYSIGIEMDNAGLLTEKDGHYFSWFRKEYPVQDVVQAVHRNEVGPKWWHRYTEIQVATVLNVCRLLVETYGIKEILGHEEISPGRKTDPGPAFPLDELRNEWIPALHRPVEPAIVSGETYEVRAESGLNIRSAPAPNAKKIAPPLKYGQAVTVLGQEGGWAYVKTEIEGWVSVKYIGKQQPE